jgi:hypothetical protein
MFVILRLDNFGDIWHWYFDLLHFSGMFTVVEHCLFGYSGSGRRKKSNVTRNSGTAE